MHAITLDICLWVYAYYISPGPGGIIRLVVSVSALIWFIIYIYG